MTSSARISGPQSLCDCHGNSAARQGGQLGEKPHGAKIHLSILLLLFAGVTVAQPGWASAQSAYFSGGAEDGFWMGDYSLLRRAGENIALEFFYSGPHSLLSRMHLNNAHGAPEPGPNH